MASFFYSYLINKKVVDVVDGCATWGLELVLTPSPIPTALDEFVVPAGTASS
jgi:hypothetical protein